MDLKCPIDEVSFYKDVREFEELGIEPEVCPCDYCKAPSECPHKCMGRGIMSANPVIVSRHAGMIEWLRRQGIKAEVLSHVEHPIQIWNRVVYGNIPYHLAAEARIVITVVMPKLRVDQRGKELSPEEMDEAGATLVAYRVFECRVPCGGDE